MDKSWILLGALLTLMAATLGWLISGIEERLNSDLAVFMPAGANARESLLLSELREGATGRLILLAVEGGEAAERSRISRHLVNRLSSSKLFTQVNNGSRQMKTGEWQLLFAYRYLLSAKVSTETFSVEQLRTALLERLHELASPFSPLYAKLIPSDPTNELSTLEQALQPEHQPVKREGVWSSGEGHRALVLAETAASGLDLDAQQKAVEQIRSAFSEASADGDYRLLLSGPGVYGIMSRELIRSEISRLGFTASALVAAIIFVAYRSLPLILLGTLPVITAMLAGVTTVTLWFGSIHGITLAFGITLLGMTTDYPIHLFSHSGDGVGAKAGLGRIWPTLRLSALTSGAAFAVLMTTSFDGLRQLGLFTITGLAAAALFTRFLMPELPGMQGVHHNAYNAGWGASSTLSGLLDSNYSAGADSRFKYPAWLTTFVMACIALSIGLTGLWLQQGLIWENDLAALSPVPQRLLAQDRELRQQLNAPEISHLLIVTAKSAEQALQQAEALQPRLQLLQTEHIIRDSDLLTEILPSFKTQLRRQEQLPDKHILRHNLDQAMMETPFRPGTFDPFIEAVERSRTLPPLSAEQTSGTLFGHKVASLLRQTGTGWLLMIPLSGVEDPQRLNREFNEHSQNSVRYVNLKNETGQLIGGFREQALYSLSWGLLLLFALLLIVLKSPARVARVVTPVALALIFDIGLLLLLGQRLSLFHIVSLLLVAGISLDYSLFINRSDENLPEHRRTLHSLTVCLASTATAFGLLALSDIPVLKAIGSTVFIGVTGGYLLSLALSSTGMKSK